MLLVEANGDGGRDWTLATRDCSIEASELLLDKNVNIAWPAETMKGRDPEMIIPAEDHALNESCHRRTSL